MKNKKLKFVFVFGILFSITFCTSVFALEDSIGDPTVPPSSHQSGLTKSPNPIDTGGNLTVTGNVSGEAYFRGNVPYRSSKEFDAPLGSEDIGSFLRRTAPVSTYTQPSYLPQPYYLPSSTVSTLAPTPSGTILTYPSIRSNQGTGEFMLTQLPKIEKIPDISGVSPLYDYSRIRPLSHAATDLERTISYEQMRERSRRALSEALQITEKEETPEQLSGSNITAEPTTNQVFEAPQPVEPAKQLEPLQPGQVSPVEKKPAAGPKYVYEQMLQEIVKPPVPQEGEKFGEERAEKPQERGPSDSRSELGQIEKEITEATGGIHKSFATESKDKFNFYMRTAEKFLKEGKYYAAVDAYSLASIYQPQDPLAYAGRSHALFASGEYMSSAYFLARAINIFPEYVNFKIDIKAMIPDQKRLESRIADVRLWRDKNNSGELSFLLAYIYYQLNQTDLAIDAINSAAETLPDSAAVKALKQAIEKK